jgi:DNA-binding transcriptional ArsR family regulator
MTERLPEPHRDEIELSQVFAALAEPMRCEVIAVLAALEAGTERSCASFGLPVAKASLTHHFKVLREAGLITQFDYGNRRGTVLRRDDIDDRFPGLLQLLVAEASKSATRMNADECAAD